MAITRFLSNMSLWREIGARARDGKRVQAAVAYFGTGGADLLPLKKQDVLLVDMSLGAVSRGETNPKEIRRLMRRGVQVFTRAGLHAKFLLADNTLIVSSANVSERSRMVLDEAGVLTTDVAAVKRARRFLEQLCTEPVREEYLKKCIVTYKPPKFGGGGRRRGARRKRITQAKLWFIGGLVYEDVPKQERETIERLERKVAKAHRVKKASVGETHYPQRQSYFDHLRLGEDWVVCSVLDRDSGVRYAEAPARVLDVVSYPRGRGKRRWILFVEEAARAQDMPLRSFRSRVRKIVPELDRDNPRTRAIADEEQADAILRLWTHAGRIAKRR
ncbi:MAG: phospholipase D-like domain-containing protein [Phycisphaerae bacterium]|nr:phospholipase D-like domain-containing protein [Phycisphaerae bacterium]